MKLVTLRDLRDHFRKPKRGYGYAMKCTLADGVPWWRDDGKRMYRVGRITRVNKRKVMQYKDSCAYGIHLGTSYFVSQFASTRCSIKEFYICRFKWEDVAGWWTIPMAGKFRVSKCKVIKLVRVR